MNLFAYGGARHHDARPSVPHEEGPAEETWGPIIAAGVLVSLILALLAFHAYVWLKRRWWLRG